MLEAIATFDAGGEARASRTDDNLSQVDIDRRLAAIIIELINACNLIDCAEDVDDIAVLIIWPGDVGDDNRVFR